MIYAELTSPEIGAASQSGIALLPIAATEQHGDHLSVNTDTALVGEIASRSERTLPQDVLLLPTLWVGSSHHHFGFPGTLSLQSETYIKVLEDLVDSLIRSGFRKIVLLNGHGGNMTPMAEALYRLALKHEGKDAPWIVGTSYWRLVGQKMDFMESVKLTHACEFETSMMLALKVDWVKMSRAKGTRTVRNSRFYDPLGYNPSLVTVCETFAQMTPNGAMGSPEKATAQKGEKLLDSYTRAFVDFLKDFIQWPAQR